MEMDLHLHNGPRKHEQDHKQHDDWLATRGQNIIFYQNEWSSISLIAINMYILHNEDGKR